jgi:hypothetical protein
MAASDTRGTSGTVPDKYLEDISIDDLSAEAPADETDANRDARRERNRRRNERRRRLRDSLPIRNLAEALKQVESRVHTIPEQCLMSITAITRQAQRIHAGEVIANLAEDAYFMRVDNRVNQPLPPGTATTKLQVVAQTSAATVLELSCRLSPTVLVQTPADPHRVATTIVRSSLTATLAAAAVTLTAAAATAEAPTMEPTRGPAEPHRVATTPSKRLKNRRQ